MNMQEIIKDFSATIFYDGFSHMILVCSFFALLSVNGKVSVWLWVGCFCSVMFLFRHAMVKASIEK